MFQHTGIQTLCSRCYAPEIVGVFLSIRSGSRSWYSPGGTGFEGMEGSCKEALGGRAGVLEESPGEIRGESIVQLQQKTPMFWRHRCHRMTAKDSSRPIVDSLQDKLCVGWQALWTSPEDFP